MSKFYRGPSIDATYQVSYHLAKRFQRKSCFGNRPIRNKNCLRRPCLLTDQNRMSNSHRGPSIDASFHFSVHLAKLFQSRRFKKKKSFRNKDCLWWPCLLMDQDEMSSIDASYQVSVHLAKWFQRRRI
jgi:hypothetical protein